MPELDLRPWVPGHMVIEVLSQRPTMPWLPVNDTWRDVEHESYMVIAQAVARSYWTMQKRGGNG